MLVSDERVRAHLPLDALVAVNDPRLEGLLRAGDAGRPNEIERLIVGVVRPVVASILARYVRDGTNISTSDGEDIASTVNLRLVTKLHALAASAEEAVDDLEKYTAALTYNAVNDHLRVLFPARARLKNRLRYSLMRDPRLALWQSGGVLCCGLAAWNGADTVAAPVTLEDAEVTAAMLDASHPHHALHAFFKETGRPAVFDALVAFFARIWRVADNPSPRAAEEPRAMTVAPIEDREYLRAVWREVKELRPMQRKALLLNLRSAETVNVIALFVLTGITTFEDIAAALELTPERLAEMWPGLPLDDLRIAALLGVSRQQVINLRKAARERLARRLG